MRYREGDVWEWLASRPAWLQWSIIGAFYLLTVMTMIWAGTAEAQTVPRNAAQLSFTAPTKNTDGTDIPTACASGVTQCGKLSLHRIEYGSCSSGAFGTKQGEITVAMPATTALVSNLVVQVYCFRAVARNDYGTESAPSNVASKTIDPPTPAAPLLSVSSTAYEIRPDSSGVLFARRVGVIPNASMCAGEGVTLGGVTYHRVDRRVVDVVNWPSTDPLVDVWAVCGNAS